MSANFAPVNEKALSAANAGGRAAAVPASNSIALNTNATMLAPPEKSQTVSYSFSVTPTKDVRRSHIMVTLNDPGKTDAFLRGPYFNMPRLDGSFPQADEHDKQIIRSATLVTGHNKYKHKLNFNLLKPVEVLTARGEGTGKMEYVPFCEQHIIGNAAQAAMFSLEAGERMTLQQPGIQVYEQEIKPDEFSSLHFTQKPLQQLLDETTILNPVHGEATPLNTTRLIPLTSPFAHLAKAAHAYLNPEGPVQNEVNSHLCVSDAVFNTVTSVYQKATAAKQKMTNSISRIAVQAFRDDGEDFEVGESIDATLGVDYSYIHFGDFSHRALSEHKDLPTAEVKMPHSIVFKLCATAQAKSMEAQYSQAAEIQKSASQK